MGYVQLAMAVLGFAKELFKYLREHEEHDNECKLKVGKAKDAIKGARRSKDTSKLEDVFKGFNFPSDSIDSQ